jgi:hypothetical protein
LAITCTNHEAKKKGGGHKPSGIDNLIIDRPREVLTSFGMSLTKGQKVTGSARTISNIYQN